MRGATGEEGGWCALPCPLLSELCWVLASQALGPQKKLWGGEESGRNVPRLEHSGNKTNQL